jgi:enoyl-CoA hydratase/carnithine racemase
MGEPAVTYEARDGVAIITINRPEKMNALNDDVIAGLRDAMHRFKDSDEAAAILTGAGERAFSAGADVNGPPRNPPTWTAIPGVGIDLDKPVIAAVSGYCIGAAIVLVQFADLAVAAENAVFHYPETQLGVSGGMIASMAARIPHKIAMELLLTGTKFTAQRAYEVGMINKVVPQGQHIEAAMEYATTLRDSAPLVIGMLKRFIGDDILPKGPVERAGLALRETQRIDQSEDKKEGLGSFKEKRRPNFKGK